MGLSPCMPGNTRLAQPRALPAPTAPHCHRRRAAFFRKLESQRSFLPVHSSETLEISGATFSSTRGSRGLLMPSPPSTKWGKTWHQFPDYCQLLRRGVFAARLQAVVD